MKYSQQEAFDRVAPHMLRQGARCMLGKSLRYRAEGCSDPFGLLMTRYTSEMEGLMWWKIKQLRLHDDLGCDGFIAQLQAIHDFTKPKHWKKALTALAKKNHLRLPREFAEL